MEPGISALNAECGAIVSPIAGIKPGEVVIKSPRPLVGGGIENPGPAACLIDCHGSV